MYFYLILLVPYLILFLGENAGKPQTCEYDIIIALYATFRTIAASPGIISYLIACSYLCFHCNASLYFLSASWPSLESILICASTGRPRIARIILAIVKNFLLAGTHQSVSQYL